MPLAAMNIGETLVIVTCTQASRDFYQQAFDEITANASQYADSEQRRISVIDAIAGVVSSGPQVVGKTNKGERS